MKRVEARLIASLSTLMKEYGYTAVKNALPAALYAVEFYNAQGITTSDVDLAGDIKQLDLSPRPHNVLRRNGVHTIAQLIALLDDPENILGMRNMGEVYFAEIIASLKANGAIQ